MDKATDGAGDMSRLLAEAEKIFPGRSMGSYFVPPWMEIVVNRAEGSRLYAMNGRSYIDYVLASGPMLIGHAHPSVVKAVQAQAALGSTYYVLNESAIKLAQTIVEAVPCGESILFASSGAEATFFALRLARAHTGRDMVLRFAGGYHGHHDYAGTPSAGIPRAVGETTVAVPFNDIAAVRQQFEQHRGKIAAVIVEPLHRVVRPQPGFLESLKQTTREAGALLIFDEIVTGFRIAWGGGQERYGVTPDLATYGKTIGGGYPVSAVCGRRDILDLSSARRNKESNYVFFSGTLNGNPVGAVAGLATLTELKKPGTYERLEKASQTLRDGFNAAAAERELPLMMVGDGAVSGVITREGAGWSPDVQASVLPQLGRGLFQRGIASNLQKVYVSLAHSDEDIALTVTAYREVLSDLVRQLAA